MESSHQHTAAADDAGTAAFLLVIPGPALVGAGAGLVMGQPLAGALVGLGMGMLIWGLIVALRPRA